jgi:hypothetical protein
MHTLLSPVCKWQQHLGALVVAPGVQWQQHLGALVVAPGVQWQQHLGALVVVPGVQWQQHLGALVVVPDATPPLWSVQRNDAEFKDELGHLVELDIWETAKEAGAEKRKAREGEERKNTGKLEVAKPHQLHDGCLIAT